ncbi:hypothetical protein NMY22_g7762 [Coprinellus aureogranulatus]|nr:hypothetical protein NMY22_g7762 [Coprinellus aureogranulatus]
MEVNFRGASTLGDCGWHDYPSPYRSTVTLSSVSCSGGSALSYMSQVAPDPWAAEIDADMLETVRPDEGGVAFPSPDVLVGVEDPSVVRSASSEVRGEVSLTGISPSSDTLTDVEVSSVVCGSLSEVGEQPSSAISSTHSVELSAESPIIPQRPASTVELELSTPPPITQQPLASAVGLSAVPPVVMQDPGSISRRASFQLAGPLSASPQGGFGVSSHRRSSMIFDIDDDPWRSMAAPPLINIDLEMDDPWVPAIANSPLLASEVDVVMRSSGPAPLIKSGVVPGELLLQVADLVLTTGPAESPYQPNISMTGSTASSLSARNDLQSVIRRSEFGIPVSSGSRARSVQSSLRSVTSVKSVTLSASPMDDLHQLDTNIPGPDFATPSIAMSRDIPLTIGPSSLLEPVCTESGQWSDDEWHGIRGMDLDDGDQFGPPAILSDDAFLSRQPFDGEGSDIEVAILSNAPTIGSVRAERDGVQTMDVDAGSVIVSVQTVSERESDIVSIQAVSSAAETSNGFSADLVSRSHLPPLPSRNEDFDDDMVSLRSVGSDDTLDPDAVDDEDDEDDEAIVIDINPSASRPIQSDGLESESVNGPVEVFMDDLAQDSPPAHQCSPTPSTMSFASDVSGAMDIRDPGLRNVYRSLRERDNEPIVCRDFAEFIRVTSMYQGAPPNRPSPAHALDPSLTPPGRPRLRNVRQPRNGFRVSCARDVRSHTFDRMDRVNIPGRPAPITSVPLGRVTRYAETLQPEHGPTLEDFQLFLDFKSVSPDARRYCNIWNKRGCEIFVPDFVQEFPIYLGHEAVVKDVFMTHIRQLENQFKAYNMRNQEEAQRNAIIARKQQLRRKICARRINIIESCRDGEGGVMDTLADTARKQIDWRCCSGDETDGDGEHAITDLPWRSEEVRKLFRIVDLAGLARRFPDGVNPSTGEFPRVRYDPAANRARKHRKEDPYRSEAPPGLPENFYDKKWLKERDPLEKKALKMTAKVEIRNLPRNLVQLAETAVPVKNRYTKPLPRRYDI